LISYWTKRFRSRSQKGQAVLIIVILLAMFLLGALGLATDYTQLWSRRQKAQAAADAACQAGAGDLYMQFANSSAESKFNLDWSWIGTDYNCSAHADSAPCSYAAANGYTGSSVAITFPASGDGICPAVSGFGTIAHPCIKVTITDPVNMSFARIITRTATVNTGASAACGLAPVAVPVPLVVLHQSADSSFSTQGNPTIKIIGGPNRSVQVDSSSSTAVNVTGSASVNLTAAGPSGSGADFGVFGQESQPAGVTLGTGTWVSPGGPYGDPWVTVSAPGVPGTAGTATPQPFGWNGCPDPNGCVEFTAGTYVGCTATGNIAQGAKGCLTLPYSGSNPGFTAFADRSRNQAYVIGQRILPSKNNSGNYVFQATTNGTSQDVANNSSVPFDQTVGSNDTVDGTVTWRNIGKISTTPQTAMFAPGLYYVAANGFNLGSGSAVRVTTPPVTGALSWRGDSTTANGDGNKGVTFYFSTAATVSVNSNSGKSAACTSASSGSGTPNGCVVSYNVDGTTTSSGLGSVPMRALQCPGGDAVPAQVYLNNDGTSNNGNIDGNILIGPCTGTYGDPTGKNRGFLFFQNRATPAAPSWGGGGQFLLSGFMYFHSSSTGATCGTGTTCLTMQGNSGAGAFTLGNIVTDQISLGGSSGIKMILNPASTFQILRPQLLR